MEKAKKAEPRPTAAGDDLAAKTPIPGDGVQALAIRRLIEMAAEAERLRFTGTIAVQIYYESGRAVAIHRRYDGRDKVGATS